MKKDSIVLLDRFQSLFILNTSFVFNIMILVLAFAQTSQGAEVLPDSTVERLIAANRYYIELTPSRPRDYRTILPLLDGFESIGDVKLKADAAFILAHYYRSVFDGVNSLNYLAKSAALYKQANLWGLYLNVIKDYCDISRSVGNFDIIEPTLMKSLLVPKQHHVGFYILDPLQQLMVHLSYTKGDYAGAVKYGLMFMDTLRKYQKMHIKNEDFEYTEKIDARIVDLELGHSYLALGKLDSAEYYLRRAEAFFLQRRDNEKLSRIYRHLAILSGNNNQKDSMVGDLNKFDKYFATHHQNRTSVLFKLPRLTRNLQSLDQAYLESQKKVKLLARQNGYILACFALVILLTLFVFRSQRKSKLDQKKINELLTRDFERSQERNDEKSRYFSILSHELRTPIFTITGLAKLLENQAYNTKENIDAIINSGNHLLHLVNNVLQHHKLEESSDTTLDEVNFEVVKTMNEVLQTTSYLAVQKNITTLFHNNLSGPQHVYGDEQKLTQILINLISNAIRYSPKNSKVEVSVSRKNIGDTLGVFSFSIRDYGIGMDTAQIPLLFDYRKTTYDVKREGGGSIKGMGIGLFVVANFIKSMASEVIVESQLGEGSIFSFDLKLKKGEPEPPLFRSFQGTNREVNVLVIDDVKINQIVTEKTLKSIGINCHAATDTDPVVQIIRDKNIDLVLMDLNMRLVSGYDLSQKIRRAGITIPIIAHTASMKENIDHEGLVTAGIQDYLIKPYFIEELKEKLTRYLSISF